MANAVCILAYNKSRYVALLLCFGAFVKYLHTLEKAKGVALLRGDF